MGANIDVSEVSEPRIQRSCVEFVGTVLFFRVISVFGIPYSPRTFTSGWSGATPYRTRPWGAQRRSKMWTLTSRVRESSLEAT